MSETSHPRHVLHLVVEGFPPERLAEVTSTSPDVMNEIFHLTPANAPAALEKIFAADAIAVWGKVE